MSSLVSIEFDVDNAFVVFSGTSFRFLIDKEIGTV